MPPLKPPSDPDEALAESLRTLLAKQGKTPIQIDAEVDQLKSMLMQQSFHDSIGSGAPSGVSSSPISSSSYARSGSPSGVSSSPVSSRGAGGGGCLLSLAALLALVWILILL